MAARKLGRKGSGCHSRRGRAAFGSSFSDSPRGGFGMGQCADDSAAVDADFHRAVSQTEAARDDLMSCFGAKQAEQ